MNDPPAENGPEKGSDRTPADPRWLAWAREIQSLGQIVRTFARNEYDTANGERLEEIAAEIFGTMVDGDPTTLPGQMLEKFRDQQGYPTPRIDVRGAIVRDGEILLVQEAQDRRWCMPGGWADVGEYPSTQVVRECEEESGYEVKPTKVIGVYDANRSGRPLEFFHAYKIVFRCEIIGGESRTSHETLDVRFFPFDDLPPLSSNRTNERHLADIQAHLADPGRMAEFD